MVGIPNKTISFPARQGIREILGKQVQLSMQIQFKLEIQARVESAHHANRKYGITDCSLFAPL